MRTVRHAVASRLIGSLTVGLLLVAVTGVNTATAGLDRSPATRHPTRITVVEPDRFDWADAGIGAAGAFGVTFVVAGPALVVHYARSERLAVRPEKWR